MTPKGSSPAATRHWPESILLWSLALVVTFAGLTPLLGLGLLGDDLVDYSYGLGQLWSGSLISHVSSMVGNANAGLHVLPIVGIARALHNQAASTLATTPLSVSQSWELLRVVWIIAGLVACSLTISAWTPLTRLPARLARHRTLIAYSILSAVALATMQIHGVWSQDPVLSYSVFSWFSAVLGFAFFAALGVVWRQSGRAAWRWSFAAAAIGITGILVYESVAAALVAGFGAMLLLIFLTWEGRQSLRRALPVMVATLVPLGVFAAVQLYRTRMPSTYDGTQFGWVAWILPVWKTGLLGGLPLTNYPLTMETTSGYDPGLHSSIAAPAAVALLFVITWVAYRRGRNLGPQVPVQIGWKAIAAVVSFCFAYWALATLVFSTTAKYQMEIETTVGRIYLFYSVALLCISVVLTMLALVVMARGWRAAIAAFVIAVLGLGIVQWNVNARSLSRIHADFAWTRTLLDGVENDLPSSTRSQACRPLRELVLPDWYSGGTMAGLDTAYQARFGEPFCPPE